MFKTIHTKLGVFGALATIILMLTGGILSIYPVMDRFDNPPVAGAMLSDVLTSLGDRALNLETLTTDRSGALVANYNINGELVEERIDPKTAAVLPTKERSAFYNFVIDFHRSFTLGTGGRVAALVTALAMMTMIITGTIALSKNLGGMSKLFGAIPGTGKSRIHAEIGRASLMFLIISTVSAIYLSLAHFEVLPEGNAEAQFPAPATFERSSDYAQFPAFSQTSLADLKSLTFPYADDPSDVFTLETAKGAGYVNPQTGQWLSFAKPDLSGKIFSLMWKLHTGQGLWWLGAILGLASFSAIWLGVSGVLIWYARWQKTPKNINKVKAGKAEIILLVGSEGYQNWGFATALQKGLTENGKSVFLSAMNAVENSYQNAKLVVILTSTYGNGEAPKTASKFLSKVPHLNAMPFVVVGFGDRSFPNFCSYAQDVQDVLTETGWSNQMPIEKINASDSLAFRNWSNCLGAILGTKIDVDHQIESPKTLSAKLVNRQFFADRDGADKVILNFKFEGRTPKFQAGDLLAVCVDAATAPRYYSISSSHKDGKLTIAVSLKKDGICSNFLHGIHEGQSIDVFVKSNPQFHCRSNSKGKIMIGAGVGVSPLVGMMRANSRKKTCHAYFGFRRKAEDYLFENKLEQMVSDHRISRLAVNFSRDENGGYVQELLSQDASRLEQLITGGADIYVCGGTDMARDVRTTLNTILEASELTVEQLVQTGKYHEDVF